MLYWENVLKAEEPRGTVQTSHFPFLLCAKQNPNASCVVIKKINKHSLARCCSMTREDELRMSNSIHFALQLLSHCLLNFFSPTMV